MKPSHARARDSEDTHALEFWGITKSYGKFSALRGVDLRIPSGQACALLGRNGAGKTTSIKILLGLAKATEGDVFIMGRSVATEADRAEARRAVSYIGDDCLYPFMTVDQFIQFRRGFFPSWRADLEERYRDLFELPPRRRIRQLSRGMQTKLGLLVAFAQGAGLVVLDEPTEGLDPVMREDVLGAMRDLVANENCTLFFSSHSLAEVEQVASHISIIEQGVVSICASRDELSRLYTSISARVPSSTPDSVLRSEHVVTMSRQGALVSLLSTDAGATEAALASASASDIESSAPSLSELFLSVVRSTDEVA